MKKKWILSCLTIAVLTSIVGGNVQAEEIKEAEKSYTEQYEIWSNLPKSEKKYYIQPMITPVPMPNSAIRNVGTTNGLPAQYQLQDEISLKVKNQGDTMQCWAFATTSVLESNIAKTTGKASPLFSVRHMDYATTKTFKDGINSIGFNRELGEGGNYYLSFAYLTNGTGAILEKEMPFENNENKVKLSEIQKTAKEKVDTYIAFPTIFKYQQNGTTINHDGAGNVYTDAQVEENRNNIKNHIMQYGAITSFTSAKSQYYNNADIFKATAYYCEDSSVLPEHAITIVGWDDNYAVTNFNADHRPTRLGAYICLNSYGTECFDDGYIYVSYEDSLIESANFGIVEASNIDYEELYQNDFYGANQNIILADEENMPVQNQIYIASTYEREKDEKEVLDKIGIGVPTNMSVEIYFANGGVTDVNKMKRVYTSTKTLKSGYQTVELQVPAEITGDKFSVVVKCNMAGNAYVKVQGAVADSFWEEVTSEAGESYISMDGSTWTDLKTLMDNTNISIKAFTKEATEEDEKPSEDTNNTANNTTNNTIENKIENTANNKVNIITDTNKVENQTNVVIQATTNDNTIATTILPKAGKIGKSIVGIIIIAVAVASCANYRRFKDIK